MLEREKILQWSEIEHDLYEENGHIFGVELDLFNDHHSYYYKHNEQYIYLEGSDIYTRPLNGLIHYVKLIL